MAAELVETSRLWARLIAAIEPEWAERLGRAPGQAHLQRAALVEEAGGRDGATRRSRCTACRSSPTGTVNYGRSTPSWPASCSSGTRWSRASGTPSTGSSTSNRALLDEVEELEHRARRRDIVVDDETLFDFYDARVRPTWSSRRALRRVVEAGAPAAARTCSTFDLDMLIHDTADEVAAERLPDAVAQGATADLPAQLPVRAGRGRRRRHRRRAARRAQPGRGRRLRLAGAGAARGAGDSLIRTLPKSLRCTFVPAPNTARAFLAAVPAGRGAAARRARARPARPPPASTCRARPGTGRRCPSTCG